MRQEFQEVDVDCPKCKTTEKVQANNMYDTIYRCNNCGEIINVPRIKKKYG